MSPQKFEKFRFCTFFGQLDLSIVSDLTGERSRPYFHFLAKLKNFSVTADWKCQILGRKRQVLSNGLCNQTEECLKNPGNSSGTSLNYESYHSFRFPHSENSQIVRVNLWSVPSGGKNYILYWVSQKMIIFTKVLIFTVILKSTNFYLKSRHLSKGPKQ